MKIYITFFLLLPTLSFGQSQTENYIKTTTYKQESLSTISSPTPAQAQVDVTYFDGLGRPMQQIGRQQSNSGKDIVTPIEYDAFGRQTKEYLPYASAQTTAAYIAPATLVTNLKAQYKTKYGTANDNPYSEKLLEASPLNRILKQTAPGSDWRLPLLSADPDHSIRLDYQANAASEVKLFTVSLSFASNTNTPTLGLSSLNSGYYKENELYKTITKDENWVSGKNNTTEEFKDKEGRVVLKRTYSDYYDINGTLISSETAHDTYYVYDDYGNLTYVLPPKMNPATTAIATIKSQLNDLGYQYKYDNRNRLAEKKLPGKQWEFIVYDKLDRVVATGPALSPFDNLSGVGWMITKYDVFSRLVYTGWMTTTTATAAGRISLQNAQNTATVLNESKLATGTIDGVPAYYSNDVAPTSFELLTVNYYDNYTFPSTPAIAIPTTVLGQTVLTTNQVKGLPTAVWTRVLTSSTAVLGETTATFYDAKARPISTYIQNYLTGYTKTDTNLNFTGVPQYTITSHKRSFSDTELKTQDNFIYTAQGRLLTHTHQINNGTSQQLLASNTYDELGQLISKGVGDVTTALKPLQKVDFAYNIRGWMTEINKTANLAQGTDPKDLFAFKINYNTISTGITGVKALYNGNIAETSWNTADIQRAYGYKYDNLNRLTAAVFQKTAVTTNAYNETLTYDKNGNIMTLKRNGGSEAAVQIDDLVYSYGPANNMNQLTKVADSSSKTTGFIDSANNGVDDYVYDANGNMTVDNNKKITDITYNHLNLPTKIIFGTTGNIVYLYNAAGQKVKKIVTIASPSSTTATDYLGGYQYLGGVLQFFPTAEGYVEPITASTFKYVFQYKDHLGNVRLSYKDISATSTPSLQILEENNYYPFGLKHTGYGPAIVSTNQALKYKYNGKELQDENIGGVQLNWYDYGARNYDPALGRWMNIDPLAEKSRRFNPYTYALNNPVFFIDPDGMEAKENNFKPDKNGNLIVEKGDTAEKLQKEYGVKVTDKDFKFKEGNVILLDNNMTRSIEKSEGVTVTEREEGSTKPTDDKNDAYICDQATMLALDGKEITPQNAQKNYGGSNAFFDPKGLKSADNFDNAKTGQAAAVIGGVHVVTYYGKSNDGTVYVYSKDGGRFKPEVKPLNTVVQQMGNSGMNTSPIKYYKK